MGDTTSDDFFRPWRGLERVLVDAFPSDKSLGYFRGSLRDKTTERLFSWVPMGQNNGRAIFAGGPGRAGQGHQRRIRFRANHPTAASAPSASVEGSGTGSNST